jgi:hypothetical protein
MVPSPHVRAIGLLVAWGVVSWLGGSGATAHAAPIYRGFLSLQLGMPIDTFLETTPTAEIQGDAGERVFSITHMPNELTGVIVTFADDRLSRIEVTYSVAYSARTSWEEFVAMAVRKYGTGFRLPTPGGAVEMWDDGHTTLILEHRAITPDAAAYGLTLQDDVVALERGDRCAPRIEV